MSMLSHTRSSFERAPSLAGSRNPDRADAAIAYLATIKRILRHVLLVLAAAGALIAIMALKIAVYLPALIHH
jgi:hypothetical protein